MILNMEEKTPYFYSEAQTKQKYAIWCRGWYLYGQKDVYNSIADTGTYIKLYKYQSSLYISNNMNTSRCSFWNITNNIKVILTFTL